jgi:hypothetical protein
MEIVLPEGIQTVLTVVGDPSKMSGFMVVARLNLDDIPLGLFASETDAESHANDNEWCRRKLEQGRRVLSVDDSAEICVAIFLFINGEFVGCRTERDFDEPETTTKAEVSA